MSNEVVNITINDNSGEIKKLFKKAVERGLEAIGNNAEGYAKKTVTHIDTGLLRNSITFALSGKEAKIKTYEANTGGEKRNYSGVAPKDKNPAVYIGSNLEYFVYHELGTGIHASDGQGRKEPWFYVDEEGKGHITSGVKPLHALKKAASEHTDEYKKLLEDSLENA